MDGINASGMAKPSQDIQTLTTSIKSALDIFESHPTSLKATAGVTGLWNDLSGLNRYNAVTAIDTRCRHALTMLATWTPFLWLDRIVDHAIKLLLFPTAALHDDNNELDTSGIEAQDSLLNQTFWMHRLVQDIHNLLIKQTRPHKSHIFNPLDYCSDLVATSYVYELPRFIFDVNKNLQRTRICATDILRSWLGFPTGDAADQYAVVDALTQLELPSSLFLLDEVWHIFCRPLAATQTTWQQLGNTRKPTHLEVRKMFHDVFQDHPVTYSDSAELANLHLLGYFMDCWFNSRGRTQRFVDPLNSFRKTQAHVRTGLTSPTPVQPLDLSEVPHIAFAQFLRNILPAVQMLKGVNSTVKNRYLQKTGKGLVQRVLARPDFLLPFRECAPTRVNAQTSIFGDVEHLRTPEGFWSILAHRAVFYGSQFALTHTENFKTLDEWNQFYASSGKPKEYFVFGNAYGPNNPWRSLDRLSEYWESRGRWTSFWQIYPQANAIQLYEFLVQTKKNPNFGLSARNKTAATDKRSMVSVFQGIGPLTALLICGDCALAGLIPMPSPSEMGELVGIVDKGALTGLDRLRLTNKGSSSREDIIKAFVNLHAYLEQELTADEKNAMHYDVIMLEHSLCKYTRLIRMPKEKK